MRNEEIILEWINALTMQQLEDLCAVSQYTLGGSEYANVEPEALRSGLICTLRGEPFIGGAP